MDDCRDSLTPRQRKRMERKEAEIRLRRDVIAVDEKVGSRVQRSKIKILMSQIDHL